ncbi:MAG: molybdenum cofactor guanylyltransferase [Anaerolineae bacterium]|jgi:molybdopterin-guanine dinucleotide biosynthesis protein A|nr:molybdenum cofactor guanylyltransferase [Anaerolineae bacterium]
MLEPTSVAILAGGQSLRMGTDKALVNLAGRPLLQHVIDRVGTLGVSIRLISHHTDHAVFGLPMVADMRPGVGPLGGVFTALTTAGAGWVLVVACDMPTLNADLLAHLLAVAQDSLDHAAVVPRWGGRAQPLHAVYHVRALPTLTAQLDSGVLAMGALLDHLPVRCIDETEVARFDPAGASFANLNTLADVAGWG